MMAQARRARPEFVIIIRISEISASVRERYCDRPGRPIVAPAVPSSSFVTVCPLRRAIPRSVDIADELRGEYDEVPGSVR